MHKTGEKMIRFCRKERSSGFSTIHEFTLYSDAFDLDADYDDVSEALYAHLQEAFTTGAPPRERSCSEKGLNFLVSPVPFQSDLVKFAKDSGYRGWGRDQHPVVQSHLHGNCPLTIATEVPVWDDEYAGFIDILRLHPDGMVEIADFKPNAAKEKKAHLQVWKYRELLIKRTGIKPERVFCTYFDDLVAYKIIDLKNAKNG